MKVRRVLMHILTVSVIAIVTEMVFFIVPHEHPTPMLSLMINVLAAVTVMQAGGLWLLNERLIELRKLFTELDAYVRRLTGRNN